MESTRPEAHFCGGIRGEVEIYASFTFESVTRTIHHLLVSDSRKYHPPTVGNPTVSRIGAEKLFLKKSSTFSLLYPPPFLALFLLPARRELAAMFLRAYHVVVVVVVVVVLYE